MELLILKDSAISILKQDIKRNKEKYDNKLSFVDEYFNEKSEDYFVKSGLEVNEFNLLEGIENDSKNAIILHKAMQTLLPIHAREEKIWTLLCHTNCWNYMQSRWGIDKDKEEGQESRIESRYFFGGHGRCRNGLARLWWGANTVYDSRLENPYEYVEEIFKSQDLFVGLCERELGRNKNLTTSILKVIREENILSESKSVDKIRKALKDIRFSGGLIMYEALPVEIIENKVRDIIIKAKEQI